MTREEISSLQTQIDVCIEEEEKLNDWENRFIESISNQLTEIGILSERQKETLKKLYDRVV